MRYQSPSIEDKLKKADFSKSWWNYNTSFISSI
jgi:hypothetical protein